jgi:hypothetical protein
MRELYMCQLVRQQVPSFCRIRPGTAFTEEEVVSHGVSVRAQGLC